MAGRESLELGGLVDHRQSIVATRAPRNLVASLKTPKEKGWNPVWTPALNWVLV